MNDIETLRGLPLWKAPPTITAVDRGRTNRNFTVESGGRTFFARIGRELPEHGIDRGAERHAALLAANAGIGPPILYAAEGVLVTEFIEGRTLSGEDTDKPHLTAIAALLRRMHQIKAEDLRPFSMAAASLAYLQQIPDADLPVVRQEILAMIGALVDPEPSCLVHCDLIPENFIEGPDGLRLVDWEYAGRSAPEVDLALVISNFALDEQNASHFLSAYGAHSASALSSMRRAAVIREFLWCLVQLRVCGPTEELTRYTDVCRRRFLELPR